MVEKFAFIGFLVLEFKDCPCTYIQILRNKLIKHLALFHDLFIVFMDKSEVLGAVLRRVEGVGFVRILRISSKETGCCKSAKCDIQLNQRWENWFSGFL